jgi:hypothetical protein
MLTFGMTFGCGTAASNVRHSSLRKALCRRPIFSRDVHCGLVHHNTCWARRAPEGIEVRTCGAWQVRAGQHAEHRVCCMCLRMERNSCWKFPTACSMNTIRWVPGSNVQATTAAVGSAGKWPLQGCTLTMGCCKRAAYCGTNHISTYQAPAGLRNLTITLLIHAPRARTVPCASSCMSKCEVCTLIKKYLRINSPWTAPSLQTADCVCVLSQLQNALHCSRIQMATHQGPGPSPASRWTCNVSIAASCF